MTVVALDGMGGDFAPRAPVEAAIRAVHEDGIEVALVGDPELLEAEYARRARGRNVQRTNLRIIPASQHVTFSDPPSAVLRGKRDASVRVAVDLVARGEADAALSAGHSGAMMAAGKHVLSTLPGIDRPAIATLLPRKRGVTVLLDSGANADCRPEHLLQFAMMGDVYGRAVLGLERPRVALLSNGSEPGKGNALVRATFALLEQAPIHFVGNLESRDLFRGKADVIVTDGFTGNVVLKVAEGTNEQIRVLTREAVAISTLARMGAWLMRPVTRELERRKNYRDIGGSLLLGVNGVTMVSHGAANARTLRNAIRATAQCVERGLTRRMAEEFGQPPGNAHIAG